MSESSTETKVPSSVAAFCRPLPYRNYFQYPPMQALAASIGFGLSQIGANSTECRDDFTIFVSVPFCRVQCNSCRYFVGLLPRRADRTAALETYTEWLVRQIDAYAQWPRWAGRECRAMYFGGGTASLLSATAVNRLIHALRGGFAISKDAESTLEGNPFDFTAEYLRAVREAGITRVSLGYQSKDHTLLKKVLNSPHTGSQASAAITAALSAGFRTVNVDLLYNVPGQTFAAWQDDINEIIDRAPQSVTTYDYVVHDGSRSQRLIDENKLPLPKNKDTIVEWQRWTRLAMLAGGYRETSNGKFALPGHEQMYSSLTYDTGCELIGFGANAYSYVNGIQFAAPNSAADYGKAVEAAIFPTAARASVAPSQRNLMERFVIFALHRSSVVASEEFYDRFGQELGDVFACEIAELMALGMVAVDSNSLTLTELGRAWRTNVLNVFYDPALRSTADDTPPIKGVSGLRYTESVVR